MIIRFTAAAVLGMALLAAPGAAQTVAEQMQKGIYAQETAGDLDGAIKIYRQILSSSPADRKSMAMAQFRLAQSLLQKGDMQEAAREFQVLSYYPEYKDVVATMAGKFRETSHGSVISRGNYTTETGRGGRYSNKASGVALTNPPGWSLVDHDSSDGGDIAVLTEDSGKNVLAVWMISEAHPASELAELLRNDLKIKPAGRPEGWKVRPESIQMGGAGDHQFLKAIADFTVSGRKIVEYLVWARSTKSHVFFFGYGLDTPPDAGYPEKFAQIVATAVIP